MKMAVKAAIKSCHLHFWTSELCIIMVPIHTTSTKMTSVSWSIELRHFRDQWILYTVIPLIMHWNSPTVINPFKKVYNLITNNQWVPVYKIIWKLVLYTQFHGLFTNHKATSLKYMLMWRGYMPDFFFFFSDKESKSEG